VSGEQTNQWWDGRPRPSCRFMTSTPPTIHETIVGSLAGRRRSVRSR
jgi:hypothetical protein